MKIDEVIKSHKIWKIHMSDYICNPDNSLKPEACHERCCELSKWMTSFERIDVQKVLNTPEFKELQKNHKLFHHNLAELVLNINRKVPISEEMALGIDSPFSRHLDNLIKSMVKIKNLLEATEKKSA
jgi:hypothetical protein